MDGKPTRTIIDRFGILGLPGNVAMNINKCIDGHAICAEDGSLRTLEKLFSFAQRCRDDVRNELFQCAQRRVEERCNSAARRNAEITRARAARRWLQLTRHALEYTWRIARSNAAKPAMISSASIQTAKKSTEPQLVKFNFKGKRPVPLWQWLEQQDLEIHKVYVDIAEPYTVWIPNQEAERFYNNVRQLLKKQNHSSRDVRIRRTTCARLG